MTKPITTNSQQDYIKTSLRLPGNLRDELLDAAARNGHSMNAEILARLQGSPLDDLKRQNEEIKETLRKILDKL